MGHCNTSPLVTPSLLFQPDFFMPTDQGTGAQNAQMSLLKAQKKTKYSSENKTAKM